MTNVRRLERRIRTARIEHTRKNCRSPIKPGQRYVRIAAMIEGTFTVWTWHIGKRDCIWKRTVPQNAKTNPCNKPGA